jgi:hypothetical protein
MRTTIKDTNWRINFREARFKQTSRMYKNTNMSMLGVNVNLDAFRMSGFPVKLKDESIERILNMKFI